MTLINWLGAVSQQEGSDGTYLVYRWSLAANWSGGAVPGAGDSVNIGAGVPGPVLQSAASVQAMTAAAGQTVTVGAFLDAKHTSYGPGSLTVGQTVTLAGALGVDATNGDFGGGALNVGGALDVAANGALSLGNALETTATTASFGSITNLGAITVAGGAAVRTDVKVASAVGFGTAGALTGVVQVGATGGAGEALVDFLGGGGVNVIAPHASLTIDGADAFLATGASVHGNSALWTLSAVLGDLTLLDGAAAATFASALTIGEVFAPATLRVDSGAMLLTKGTITINAGAALDVGGDATTHTHLYAPSVAINGGAMTMASGAVYNNPIAFSAAGGTLNLINEVEMNVGGSPGVVNLTNSRVKLTGGGFTVNALAGTNFIYLVNAGGADDYVNGGGAHIELTNARATIAGGGDAVFLLGADDQVNLVGSGGAVDHVFGSNGKVRLSGSLEAASVNGGGNEVFLQGFNRTDLVQLINTNGADDIVFSDDQTVTLTNAQATVNGSGNYIALLGNQDTVMIENSYSSYYALPDTVLGAGVINLQAGSDVTCRDGGCHIIGSVGSVSQANLYGTSAAADVVDGVGTVELQGNGARATLTGVRSAYLFGADDIVTLASVPSTFDASIFGSQADLTLYDVDENISGGGNAIHLYGGTSYITLLATNGVADRVDSVNVAGDVIGAGQITLSAAQAVVQGAGAVVDFATGTTGDSVELTGFTDLYGFQLGPLATVNGANGAITIDAGVSNIGFGGAVTVNGGGDHITLGHDDALTLNGNANLIDLSGQTAVLDSIAGFNATDIIEFSIKTFANFQALQAATTQSSADAVISGNGARLVLTNTQAGSLTASEFKFV